MQKPKKTQNKKPSGRDGFQTPDSATDLIVPYLTKSVIWECAAGGGLMAKRLRELGHLVVNTTLDEGEDFLKFKPPFLFGQIVTNPPWSLKEEFYEKCLSYTVPFALLIPTDFCGWILRAMRNPNVQWLVPTRRIKYYTPSGKPSNPQMHSGWLTFGMNLPEKITIVNYEYTEEQ